MASTSKDKSGESEQKRKELGSACSLWHVITGRSPIRAPHLIKSELELYKSWLQLGLSRYKSPNDASSQMLKSAELKDYQRAFVLRISKLLHLDESQTLDLFRSYLQNAFRGSQKQLKAFLSNEKHYPRLLSMIVEFYLEERLYLLLSLSYIFSHWQQPGFRYRGEFAGCVEQLDRDGQFPTLVLEQYKACSEWQAPSADIHGRDASPSLVSKWVVANLREQAALLELLLLYFKDFQHPADKLLVLIKLFHTQAFGCRQVNLHLFDSVAESWIAWIGHLQVLVILEGLDLDSIMQDCSAEVLFKHHILSSEDTVHAITQLMAGWGDFPQHAPLMLAWAIMLFLRNGVEASSALAEEAQRLGARALQAGALRSLHSLVQSNKVEDGSAVANVCHVTVHNLLALALDHFAESSLGDVQMLVSVVSKTVGRSLLCLQFWEGGADSQTGHLLKALANQFPLQVLPFLDLITALSSAELPAKRVFDFLRSLSAFAEPLSDAEMSSGVECSSDGTQWTATAHRVLFPSVDPQQLDSLVLPAGTFGYVDGTSDGGRWVVWQFSFTAWQYFLLQINQYLYTASLAKEAIPELLTLHVTAIVRLVKQLLAHDWSLSEVLQPVTDRIYLILQRSALTANPPVDLITACVHCISVIACQNAPQVWVNLHQIGFLPHRTTMAAAEGLNMASGRFGQLLAVAERPRGCYSITLATLELLAHLMKSLASPDASSWSHASSDWAACLSFVTQEVFVDFHKWRYQDSFDRERIGLRVLKIFQAMLSSRKTLSPISSQAEESSQSGILGLPGIHSLSELLVHSLLHGEASQSILNILATGVETINSVTAVAATRLCATTSDSSSLIELVKCALSVVSQLLQAKGEEVTPLEKNLAAKTVGQPTSGATVTSLFGERVHAVAVIAGYIHHRQDTRLPTLATRLLKQLCLSGTASIHACLGGQAVALRDTFVTRLRARAEETKLKTAILDLLTTAVQVQPGLIELFLDLTPVDSKGASSMFNLSRGSCVHPVLSFLESPCHPKLLSSSLSLLFALWKDRRIAALMAICETPKFWHNLSRPLFENPPNAGESPDAYCDAVQNVVYTMQILTVEMYYAEELDDDLKNVLTDFAKESRFTYWTEQLFRAPDEDMDSADSSEMESSVSVAGTRPLTKKKSLLTAFMSLVHSYRSLVTVMASYQPLACGLKSSKSQAEFLSELICTINGLSESQTGSTSIRAAVELSALLLVLCQKWSKELSSCGALLCDMSSLLTDLFSTCQTLGEHAWSSFATATLLLLQNAKKSQSVDKAVVSLLPVVCDTLHIFNQAIDEDDGQSLVLSIYLLGELVQWREHCQASDSDELPSWQAVLSHKVVCPLLTSVLERCLATPRLMVVESVLGLFLLLSQLPQGAEAVASPQLAQHICLSMVTVLSTALPPTSSRPSSGADIKPGIPISGQAGSAVAKRAPSKLSGSSSWLEVWCLILQLSTNLLTKLRHHFIQTALDFVASHQDRIVQCLENFSTTTGLTQSHLDVMEHTVAFLHELAGFHRQWQLFLAPNFALLRDLLLQICHQCCAILYRPSLLARLAEPGGKIDRAASSSQARLMLRRYSNSPPTLRERVLSSSSDIVKPKASILKSKGSESTPGSDKSLRGSAASMAATPRRISKRPHQISFCEEEAACQESPAFVKMQSSYIRLFVHCLGSMRCLLPDISVLLRNAVFDLVECPVLVAAVFTQPIVDSGETVSFGDLLAGINVCLDVMPRPSSGETPVKSLTTLEDRPTLMLIVESALLIIMLQSARYLRDATVEPSHSQYIRRELSSELYHLLNVLSKQFRRPIGSPAEHLVAKNLTSTPSTNFSMTEDEPFFMLVEHFVQNVLN